MDITYDISPCSLGLILVAATTRGVCAILLGDDADALRSELAERFPEARCSEGALSGNILDLVENPRAEFACTLDMHGTSFQQRVWQALREIPVGSTATYTDIAQAIGEPKATRAVAQACAANPVAVVVPCHRVIRRDGKLAGYRWGLERKRVLLERESFFA